MFLDMIIVHLNFRQPEIDKINAKYTWLDNFAQFGGNFGIFAELTGCTFLGLLNICFFMIKRLFS